MTLETILWIIFFIWAGVGIVVFLACLQTDRIGTAFFKAVFWPFRILGEIVEGVLD